MKSVVFSRQASRDIDLIWRHSTGTWGEKQTDSYLEQIEQICSKLAGMPELGQAMLYHGKDIRRFPTSSHMIYYKIRSANQLFIVRVLHKRMNQADHV